MRKLTRRELAQLSAAMAAAGLPALASATAGAVPVDDTASAAAQETNYIGPLTGVTGVENRRFDPVDYTMDLFAAAPRKLRFQARARAEAEAWQKTLRAKLTELMGGFPRQRGALQAFTIETRTFPGYRREKFVFNSRPGMSVLGYVLLPDNAPRPVRTMICVPGHGRGVDDIVGIDERGRERTDKAGYQHDFAIQAVEAGMAAVAIEPIGFGCRRDPINARKSLSAYACEPTAGSALLVGQTMIGWRVWDVMRTIDYITERPELDARRIGCMGISGGGMVTLFATALEPRINVAMVSGYLNTFRDSIGSVSHCIDNYVPNISNWAEMHDIGGLIAPRPLFVESGEKDRIFPVLASVASFNLVKAIYEVFGAADRVEQEVFPEEHSFWGKRGIPFLARHL